MSQLGPFQKKKNYWRH